jgi:hypothetical protein
MLIVKVQLVRKTGTTAIGHGDAQAAAFARIAGQELLNLLGSACRQGKVDIVTMGGFHEFYVLIH